MVIVTASEHSLTAKAGSLRYGWFRAVILLLSAALAWIVIHIHFDISSSDFQTASLPFAVNVSPAIAAERNYAVGRTDQAEALATIALKRTPLSIRSLRTFALSAQERGDTELSGRAMGLAGALGWRDTPTQLWLIQALWRQGDYAAALERADAISRRNQLRDKMRALFLSAALEHYSRYALADRLLSQPSWRPYFFEGAHFLPRSKISAYSDFLQFFIRRGGRLTMSEMEPFAATLYENKYYRQGWLHWRAAVEHEKLQTDKAVFDGDFDVSVLNPQRHPSVYEWRFPQSAGVNTSLGTPPMRSYDRAIFAASEGNVRAKIAVQTLALEPGQYIFSVQALPRDDREIRSFSWEIYCVESGRSVALADWVTQPLDYWTLLTAKFNIPPGNCEAQQLNLFLNGNKRQPIDIWFDKIAVLKV